MRKIFTCLLSGILFESCLNSASQPSKKELQPLEVSDKLNPDTLDSLVNKKSQGGKKVGFWIEENGHRELYYLDGKRHGIYKSYFPKNNRLEALGQYDNGEPTGLWYYFDESGKILMTEVIRSHRNVTAVRNQHQELLKPKFESYVKIFGENGAVREEGTALYDEDLQIDFYKFGVWKYYDPSGNFVRSEIYKEGKLAE
jgi:antitoxin component YwqK of YwqJK toxin-antitoxin module